MTKQGVALLRDHSTDNRSACHRCVGWKCLAEMPPQSGSVQLSCSLQFFFLLLSGSISLAERISLCPGGPLLNFSHAPAVLLPWTGSYHLNAAAYEPTSGVLVAAALLGSCSPSDDSCVTTGHGLFAAAHWSRGSTSSVLLNAVEDGPGTVRSYAAGNGTRLKDVVFKSAAGRRLMVSALVPTPYELLLVSEQDVLAVALQQLQLLASGSVSAADISHCSPAHARGPRTHFMGAGQPNRRGGSVDCSGVGWRPRSPVPRHSHH